MTEPLLSDAERIRLAREYFGFYIGWVHETDMQEIFGGKAVPAEHHEEMIQALTEDDRHTLIVAPRGSAKTTIVQAWVEWMLGKASLSDDKNWAATFRVIYISHAAERAYTASLAIKNTIKGNAIYKAVFPKVKPFIDKWSEPQWRVQGNEDQKDPTFTAAGIESPPLGARGTIIILDDIGDEKNMSTPLQRDHVRYTLNRTIVPMRVPRIGRFVMVCTRWAWDDAADWAEKRRWKTLAKHPMKALIEEGTESDAVILDSQGGGATADGGESATSQGAGRRDEDNLPRSTADTSLQSTSSAVTYRSYWPERFSVEELLQMRADDPRGFAQQMQNEVAPEEGLVFERIWFTDRFDVPPGEILLRLDTWDTAAGQGRNRSFSVGLSAAVSRDFHIYLLNMLRAQLPYPDLKEAMRMTARRNKSNAVIIEAKSSGQQAIQELWQEGYPIVAFQPFGQKGSPAREEGNVRTSDICAQRRVHLPTDYFCRQYGSRDWLPDFEREVFSYPDGEHDDIVDALCQMLWWVEEQRLRHQQFVRRSHEPQDWGVSYKPEDQKMLV